MTLKHRRERGFNQCELIIQEILKLDSGANFSLAPDAVEKVRETEIQSRITDRKKKVQNVAGCFRVSDVNAVRGKTIFVIDDVVTTGSTMAEMKRVLLEAGAKNVEGFAFAH